MEPTERDNRVPRESPGKWIMGMLRHALVPLRDPVFYLLLAPGLLGFILPRPSFHLDWDSLLVKAFAEELVFRAFLQGLLAERLPREWRLGPLTAQNVLASAIFALFHLVHQPPNALLVFFPSLLFGFAWDRYGSVVPCGLIHFFYNLCLFSRP